MSGFSKYFQSDDFKRASRNTADSAIKLIFRWLGWGLVALKNFLTDMFKMVFGMK